MPHPPDPGRLDPTARRAVTQLETDEDIRLALLSGLKGQHPSVPVEKGEVIPPEPCMRRPSSPYRPTVRPPLPILTVFDDGRLDGEIIRIRQPRFIIGRTEGDLRFPLDGRMSSRHVEITYQLAGGQHRWVVTDLQSTHGMFVRVSRTVLSDKAEFLVGNGLYRFDSAQADRDATPNLELGEFSGRTQGLDEDAGIFRPPALTELLGKEIGNRLLLVKDVYWIGTEPSCQICRPDDPFCEPRHAKLYRGQQGQWNAQHNKTQNGLWIKMTQIVAQSIVHFQIGEQRFKLKVH